MIFDKRLRDFCAERLRYFCVWRGCTIFLTQSLTHSGCVIFFWRLRDFFFAERLCEFFVERLREFFVESLHDFFVERLHDFFLVEML